MRCCGSRQRRSSRSDAHSPDSVQRSSSRSRRTARGRAPRWPSSSWAAIPIYTRGEEVGLDVRESVEDVARIMSGYHAVLAARVFEHSVVERLAAAASVPVVNMLSDHSHPLQALADTPHHARGARRPRRSHGGVRGRLQQRQPARWPRRRSCWACTCGLGCPVGFDAGDDELARLDRARQRHHRTARRPRSPPCAVPTSCTPTPGHRWARRPRRPNGPRCSVATR